jgi:hypothetical protein
MHFTPAGHRVMSGALLAPLVEILLADPRFRPPVSQGAS